MGRHILPIFSTPAGNPASFGGLKQLYSQYLLRCIMYYLLRYYKAETMTIQSLVEIYESFTRLHLHFVTLNEHQSTIN